MHFMYMKSSNALVSVFLSVLIITSAGCHKTTSDKLPRSNVAGDNTHTKAVQIDRLLRTLNEQVNLRNNIVLKRIML